MRVISIISFTIAATIFTYLIGATLASPVGQVLYFFGENYPNFCPFSLKLL